MPRLSFTSSFIGLPVSASSGGMREQARMLPFVLLFPMATHSSLHAQDYRNVTIVSASCRVAAVRMD